MTADKKKVDAVDAKLYRKIFAENLKRIRIKKGMTQKELSLMSSVDLQALYRYERASADASALNTLKIAGALGITMDELYGAAPPLDSVSLLKKVNISAAVHEEQVHIIFSDNGKMYGKYVLPKETIDNISDKVIEACTPIIRELLISFILQEIVPSNQITKIDTKRKYVRLGVKNDAKGGYILLSKLSKKPIE